MAANNPRKFKDRIAQLAQKQAEGTAQFQEVMREVAEVKKTQQTHPALGSSSSSVGGGGGNKAVGGAQTGFGATGISGHVRQQQQPQQQQQQPVLMGNSEGMVIPRHLSPVQLPPHPHYRIHGGSLPNVNQIIAHQSDPQIQQQAGFPVLPQGAVPSDYSALFALGPLAYNNGGGVTEVSPAHDRSRGGSGGGAIRHRSQGSGERRQWETSPYGCERGGGSSGGGCYSSSLSTYLSPPPESRWRRTSSDSAIYQSLKSPQQQLLQQQLAMQQQQGGSSNSEGESPVSLLEDVKPPADFFSHFYQPEDAQVKQEPKHNGIHDPYRSPKSPCSPCSPMTPPGGSSPTYHTPFMPMELETGFQRFRIETPTTAGVQQQQQQQQHRPHPQHLPLQPFQDQGGGGGSGGLVGFQNPDPPTPNTGPTSPHTPGALPGFLITDWDQSDCKDNLDADFVETLREGLEPIDDQLLATLTGQHTFVDPAVEEQFKMNY